MNEKLIYLDIAGFTIELRFHKSSRIYNSPLQSAILSVYRGFIANQRLKKADCTIVVQDRDEVEMITDETNRKHFIQLYIDETDRRIRSFNDINIIHFQVILAGTVQKLLAKRNAFYLHASASRIDNKAYLFMGPSGAGKSTSMKLLRDKFPALGDDSVIIKKEGKEFFFYQTPLTENAYWVKKRKERHDIGGIFFLKKSNEFRIQRLTDKEYICDRFIAQFSTDGKALDTQIKNVLEFVAKFDKFYLLSFAKDKRKMQELFTNYLF